MKLPFDISRGAVSLARLLSAGTLQGVQGLVTGTLNWSGQQLESLAGLPLIEGTEMGDGLKNSGDALKGAGEATDEALGNARDSVNKAMRIALDGLDFADETTRRTLYENIPVTSIVGESFIGLKVSDIQPAFRLEGHDVDADQVIAAMKESGLEKAMLCVPGLFCDELMWSNTGDPEHPAKPLDETIRALGYYPVLMRFNPGLPIPENGASFLKLAREFLGRFDGRVSVLTYSQGGLLLRSALYQEAQDRKVEAGESRAPDSNPAAPGHANMMLAKRIHRAVLIASPDGGSYIEKIGYWLTAGFNLIPGLTGPALSFIGNQRSEAMKDLSHGIIRPSDREAVPHPERYNSEQYFGELDDIDAWQIFGVLSESDAEQQSWIGDGVIERPSLGLLSEKVFRAKGPDRVHCIHGKSHFDVHLAEETHALLLKIFAE